jgi:hypothetical protein
MIQRCPSAQGTPSAQVESPLGWQLKSAAALTSPITKVTTGQTDKLPNKPDEIRIATPLAAPRRAGRVEWAHGIRT